MATLNDVYIDLNCIDSLSKKIKEVISIDNKNYAVIITDNDKLAEDRSGESGE